MEEEIEDLKRRLRELTGTEFYPEDVVSEKPEDFYLNVIPRPVFEKEPEPESETETFKTPVSVELGVPEDEIEDLKRRLSELTGIDPEML